MAKFCTKCGKKLEEGKTCDCQKKKKTVKEEETNDVAKEVGEAVEVTAMAVANNDYVKKIVEIVKTIFKTPVNTLKKNTKDNNFIVGVIVIALNSIITGLFLYLLLKEGTEGFGSFSLLYAFGTFGIEIPFVKVVLYIAVYVLAGFFSTAVAIYAIQSWIFKAKTSFKKIISLMGTCAVISTIGTLIAILGIYLIPQYIMLILILGGLFYFTYLFQGIKFTSDQDENTYGYTFVSALVFMGFILFYLIPKIFV